MNAIAQDNPNTKAIILDGTPTFETIFVSEYPAMVALAAAVSQNRSQAEDIAQEAMSRLNRDWDKVKTYDKPGAWLRRVTINLALSSKRRLLTESKALLKLQPVSELPPEPSDHQAIWASVKNLPKRQRSVLALHFLEDIPLEEIAEILEIAPSTARVHLHRARQSLHTQLTTAGSENNHDF